MNCYTYIYTDPERLVPIYVGKGKGLRAYDHLREVKKNSRFRNRMKTLNKLNLTPNIEIFEMPDENAAFLAEVELIKLYGRKDLKTGTLYNMTNGGEGAAGAIHSKETKQKRSKSVKASYTPELRELRSKQFKGKTATDEAKIKMSRSRMGTIRSEESKLKQSQSLRGGNNVKCKTWTLQSPVGQRYSTKDMTTFCNLHNLNYSSLRNRAREKSHEPLGKGLSRGWIVISCV